MTEVKIKGKCIIAPNEVLIEFGRTQCGMEFSRTGSIQRKLKLDDNDKVEVIVRKL